MKIIKEKYKIIKDDIRIWFYLSKTDNQIHNRLKSFNKGKIMSIADVLEEFSDISEEEIIKFLNYSKIFTKITQ